MVKNAKDSYRSASEGKNIKTPEWLKDFGDVLSDLSITMESQGFDVNVERSEDGHSAKLQVSKDGNTLDLDLSAKEKMWFLGRRHEVSVTSLDNKTQKFHFSETLIDNAGPIVLAQPPKEINKLSAYCADQLGYKVRLAQNMKATMKQEP